MRFYAGYEMSEDLTPIAVFNSETDRDAWLNDTLLSANKFNNDRYNRLKEFEPNYNKRRIPLTYEEAKEILGGDWFEYEEGEDDPYFEQITWYEF